jgi:malate dehydrogenase (oxaloacetate-decarboxylating)(NADP+)
MCDSRGVIHSERENLTPEKAKFALKTDARSLADALVGADVFIGVSVADCVSEEMVKSMAPDPVIFPMANPTPEILPQKAIAAGAAVVGTGRSDFQNQINNVLGFPGIFRGALDSRASDINEEMKIAAARGLAEIAEEKIPEDVLDVLANAYPEDTAAGMFEGESPLKKSYVIPKPFDPRVVPRVARYVADAAIKSGVATIAIDDLDAYEKSVAQRVKKS